MAGTSDLGETLDDEKLDAAIEDALDALFRKDEEEKPPVGKDVSAGRARPAQGKMIHDR